MQTFILPSALRGPSGLGKSNILKNHKELSIVVFFLWDNHDFEKKTILFLFKRRLGVLQGLSSLHLSTISPVSSLQESSPAVKAVIRQGDISVRKAIWVSPENRRKGKYLGWIRPKVSLKDFDPHSGQSLRATQGWHGDRKTLSLVIQQLVFPGNWS